jgi:hypothetical protein
MPPSRNLGASVCVIYPIRTCGTFIPELGSLIAVTRRSLRRHAKETALNASEMNPPDKPGNWLREELLHLLTLSGTMAGLSITGVTLFYTVGHATRLMTIADDLLAASSVMFLLCCYLIFWALRTRSQPLSEMLVSLVDFALASALTVMVFAGFLMAYTVW